MMSPMLEMYSMLKSYFSSPPPSPSSSSMAGQTISLNTDLVSCCSVEASSLSVSPPTNCLMIRS